MSRIHLNGGASTACREVLAQLSDDHECVERAYREFQGRYGEEDGHACEAIAQQLLDKLTVHAALEDEFLYPATRGVLAEPDLIDEAVVEHESANTLMQQFCGLSWGDENYAARFTVLCEHVLSHAKEEEGELFPRLERARLDWPALNAQMNERRAQLTGQKHGEGSGEALEDESADPVGDGGKSGISSRNLSRPVRGDPS